MRQSVVTVPVIHGYWSTARRRVRNGPLLLITEPAAVVPGFPGDGTVLLKTPPSTSGDRCASSGGVDTPVSIAHC
ncbi:hypothetical protein KCP70_08955 [Salmonella enterica subsp. enterica]|nr:hypothetical protein KCP70_08955 [Salmonella enterica subsp. enterica]